LEVHEENTGYFLESRSWNMTSLGSLRKWPWFSWYNDNQRFQKCFGTQGRTTRSAFRENLLEQQHSFGINTDSKI